MAGLSHHNRNSRRRGRYLTFEVLVRELIVGALKQPIPSLEEMPLDSARYIPAENYPLGITKEPGEIGYVWDEKGGSRYVLASKELQLGVL
jgi:hypothetical protein